jgi:hypothetical protein
MLWTASSTRHVSAMDMEATKAPMIRRSYIHASPGGIWGLTVNGRNGTVQLTLKGVAHEAVLCPRRLFHGPSHRRP